ncbi:hypothetical protein Golob_025208, partial [Gossypium lobatum]|nr:hypothetical protein [Gossypium lobatum]
MQMLILFSLHFSVRLEW